MPPSELLFPPHSPNDCYLLLVTFKLFVCLPFLTVVCSMLLVTAVLCPQCMKFLARPQRRMRQLFSAASGSFKTCRMRQVGVGGLAMFGQEKEKNGPQDAWRETGRIETEIRRLIQEELAG